MSHNYRWRCFGIAVICVLALSVLGTAAPAARAQTATTNYKIKWKILSGALYLDKKETRKLAVGSGLGASASVLLPPPFDVVSGLVFASAAAYAANADIDGKCVGIKILLSPFTGATYYPFSYGPKDKNGRYCR